MRKRKIILISIFIILIVLFLFASFSFFHKIKNFKEHKDFFKQPKNEQKVEDWMDFIFVEKHYKINVNEVLNEDMNIFDKKKPILNYCEKKQVNCTEILEKLNLAKENKELEKNRKDGN